MWISVCQSCIPVRRLEKRSVVQSDQEVDAMARKKRSKVSELLERFSYQATKATGTSRAFILAVLVIIAWAITGPLFKFSDTWQLVINTGTTIVTFLMVFLIQRTQNKDALAIHLKLNEIVAALEGASNRLIDAENLSEEELHSLGRHYGELAGLAAKDVKITESHSIEEAQRRHTVKRGTGSAAAGRRH